MKKVIALLVSLIIVIGCSAPALAVREKDYDHLPQVYVAGIGSKKVYLKDDPEKNSLFYPIPTDKMLDNLKNLPNYALDSVKNGDPKLLYNMVYNWLYETFQYAGLEKDGFTTKENTTLDPMVLDYDGDGEYYFSYDCRLDPVDIAHQLHEYIGWVQEDSGSQKIELVGSSYGTSIVVAYLNEYKDYRKNIDSVVLCVPSLGGVDLVGQLFAGDVTVTPVALAQFISVMLGNEDVDLIVSVLRKSGIFDPFITYALEPVLEAALMEALIDFVETIVGTCPSMWTFVQDKYFYDALENVYGEDYNSDDHEYAVLIDRLIYYHENVMNRATEIFEESVADGVKMNVICKYGRPAVPLSENGNFRSDGAVGLTVSSFGATCSMRDELLPEDYKQAKYPEYNFISADRCVDASTCALPFNTWIIRGLEHSQKNEDYYDLINTILYEDLDVFTSEKYPQFLQLSSEDSERLVPLEPLPEEKETTLIEDVVKLVKRLVELAVDVIKKLAEKE